MSDLKVQQSQAQIVDLPFPDSVRLRRGMYISNLNQMVTEIIDNSVDEHFAGYCNSIAVLIEDNKTITIMDNGRGIPCGPSKANPDVTQVELAFTTLHAGGKFGNEGGYGKKTSGMNGVGGSCVQALSEIMEVTVNYGGNSYLTTFAKGHITGRTTIVGTSTEEERGTTVRFTIDEEVWTDSDPLNTKALNRRIKQIAYLNPGLTMYFMEMINGEIVTEKSYLYEEGLKTYIEELTKNKKKLMDTIGISVSKNDIDIDIGMVYTNSYNEELYSFCNNMATVDNGDHLTGFTMGLNSSIKKYIESINKTLECKTEDIKEGLVAVVSVRVGDPIFEGQAKSKLKMMTVRNAVKDITEEALLDYLDKNPDIAKVIIAKIEEAVKARIAAAKAREAARGAKNLVSEGSPDKLAENLNKDPNKSEIWIVEGDSAGGSAKQARDRDLQAILPVFGKVNNVEKSRLENVIKNEKLNLLIRSARFGIGPDFDLSKSRYCKYIIASDADIDGFHIACLWITYFYRYLKPVIEAGMLYISQPPLFKIVKSKKEYYAYSDTERDSIIADLGGKADNVQRYKGLGEMNPGQLWDTTMNPATRRLIRVTLEDCELAEEAISLCMSEDSGARKEWIMENGNQVHLD